MAARRSGKTPASQGGGWIHSPTRWAIYHRDDFRCVYCGKCDSLTLDHIHPVEEGGDDHPSNLVTACGRCNTKKGAKSKVEWYRELRSHGICTEKVRRRIKSQTKKALDRAVGRLLSTRGGSQPNPGHTRGLIPAKTVITVTTNREHTNELQA